MKKILFTVALVIASMTAMTVLASEVQSDRITTEKVDKKVVKVEQKAEKQCGKAVKRNCKKARKNSHRYAKQRNPQTGNTRFQPPMSEFDGLNITPQQRESLRKATVERGHALDNTVSTIEVGQYCQKTIRACEDAQVAFLNQVKSILTPDQYQQYIDSMPLAVQVATNY